jgi:hypothetical protein
MDTTMPHLHRVVDGFYSEFSKLAPLRGQASQQVGGEIDQEGFIPWRVSEAGGRLLQSLQEPGLEFVLRSLRALNEA